MPHLNLLEAGRASGVVLDGQSSCVYVAFFVYPRYGGNRMCVLAEIVIEMSILNKFFSLPKIIFISIINILSNRMFFLHK